MAVLKQMFGARDWASTYALLYALVNRCFGKAGLAVATTTTLFKTANQVYYAIADTLYSKAATDNIALSPAPANTAAGQVCILRVEIDSAGTVTVKQGPIITGGAAQAIVPRRTAARATFGWIEIPASFTFGTSLFSAAGVTFHDGDPDLGTGSGNGNPDRGIDSTVYSGP